MATAKNGIPSHRRYHSPQRERQAQETRSRILAAARELFRSAGYAGTTLDHIAEEAGVSPKTVSAAYGSKVGILAALVLPTTGGGDAAIERVREAADPARRIERVAELCGTVYGGLTPEFELLRGASMLAPELGQLARQIEERRRTNGARLVAYLAERGALRQDVDADAAADILWTLTAYDAYRALVVERGWQPERYQAWLRRVLMSELLADGEPRG
jgi:AcrR family transcriptional regulator